MEIKVKSLRVSKAEVFTTRENQNYESTPGTYYKKNPITKAIRIPYDT